MAGLDRQFTGVRATLATLSPTLTVPWSATSADRDKHRGFLVGDSAYHAYTGRYLITRTGPVTSPIQNY